MKTENSLLEQQIKNHPDLPRHIGIIMDGNGRWAKKRHLPRIAGHNAGIESVRRIVRESAELGIKVLTLYTFSHENWKRPRFEVSALMKLLLNTINRKINELMENNVRIKLMKAPLPGIFRRLDYLTLIWSFEPAVNFV